MAEPKKNALIRIWQILLRHSDYDHPLLQEDILRYLDEEYDIQLERKAVGKNLAYLRDAGIDVSTIPRKGFYIASRDFDEETIVFDIETTGLSVQNCKITEIGAVKVKGGKVTEVFNTFVNPEVEIPEEIVKLTSITNEMVADAPKIKEALTSFFAFIGDESTRQGKLMVAHNASFDMGFIRQAAHDCEMEFNNPYLDTVALSRYLNPDLKKHKLDTIAEYYNLGEFHHHRACDDADMLAAIYLKMIASMREHDILSFEQLKRDMSTSTNPLSLKPYHQIILVKNKIGLKNLYKLISFGFL